MKFVLTLGTGIVIGYILHGNKNKTVEEIASRVGETMAAKWEQIKTEAEEQEKELPEATKNNKN